jgi:dUTP pyrophosphatase
MERIAKFEKVSFQQFFEAWLALNPGMSEEQIRRVYQEIRLPERATAGSAGYDFFSPADFVLAPRQEVLIPTGIRVKMNAGYVLMLFPRSSLGFKYRLQMNNTVGVIDSDYANARNEGHIFCKLTNDTHDGRTVTLNRGDGIVQGVFLPFGITSDDAAQAERTGGIGSTTQKKVR